MTSRSGRGHADLIASLPRPVGFVLGGGATFGAVQVGMLQALAEIPLAPDLVVGTSVGAINGALLAEDPVGAANRLSHLWLEATRDLVFPGRGVERMRAWHRHRSSLASSDALRDLLAGTLATERIEDLPVPFAATAMDLASGRVVHLESGPLIRAVLASAAVPGLFPSVRIDGRELVDGGVISNVPIDHALRIGARSVVVLDCGVFGLRPQAPETLPEIVAHVVGIMMREQAVRDVPEVAREVPVVYLPGPFPMVTSPLQFSASARLMRQAYDETRAFLATVEIDGPGLYGTPPLIHAAGGHEPAPSESRRDPSRRTGGDAV